VEDCFQPVGVSGTSRVEPNTPARQRRRAIRSALPRPSFCGHGDLP
jgi:hypothetical protein